MNKVIDFIKGSIDEMTNHVTWSKYSELQSSTILVIVASLIFAVLIGVIDLAFENGMKSIYDSFIVR
jgi:preprotein translocase subunit SecE